LRFRVGNYIVTGVDLLGIAIGIGVLALGGFTVWAAWFA
jgi:hypothetical protein